MPTLKRIPCDTCKRSHNDREGARRCHARAILEADKARAARLQIYGPSGPPPGIQLKRQSSPAKPQPPLKEWCFFVSRPVAVMVHARTIEEVRCIQQAVLTKQDYQEEYVTRWFDDIHGVDRALATDDPVESLEGGKIDEWEEIPEDTRTIARDGNWIIRSKIDKDENGVSLFWSNENGWGDKASATIFSQKERARLRLPIAGEWVDLV